MVDLTRRGFVSATAAALAGAYILPLCAEEASQYKTVLHKALIQGLPTEGSLAPLKAAGFTGIECSNWGASSTDAENARKIADGLGMRIHSVMRGWADFNNQEKFDSSIASVEKALETASILGADAILLVPCRIGVKPMPEPWEFDIKFDEQNGHIKQVVNGDNSAYAEYINAHNIATDMSRKALEKLIPAAEKRGVVIAVENVWNNLWVKPDLFAAFVRSFESRWLKAYFDIGNHVKYAPPEEWIKALGSNIVKCHVKDFKLGPNGRGGSFVNIREGSVNWPVVRNELDKIGYNGWMTIEGGKGLSLDEQNKRLDLIIAGKQEKQFHEQ